MKDRVYDRAIPARLGWMVTYDPDTHTGDVQWDDGHHETAVPVDHLGSVPNEAA